MNIEKVVNVLSLGAGVQSSALAMLYDTGRLKPMPDFAVFADTGAEPKAVYEYLEILMGKVKNYKIHVVMKGNIVDDTLSGNRFASAPFFILKPDKTIGMGRRQCTNEYKIQVIIQAVRKVLKYKPRKRMKHKINMIIGISCDEMQRMKESLTPWITNKYPLVDEMSWYRQDCKDYFETQNMPTPPRSACWMCPYRNDDEWIHLKDNHPEEFKMACDFDKKIRTLRKFKNENFLHKSCVPLAEVTLYPKNDPNQLGIFSYMQNECDGMCGL